MSMVLLVIQVYALAHIQSMGKATATMEQHTPLMHSEHYFHHAPADSGAVTRESESAKRYDTLPHVAFPVGTVKHTFANKVMQSATAGAGRSMQEDAIAEGIAMPTDYKGDIVRDRGVNLQRMTEKVNAQQGSSVGNFPIVSQRITQSPRPPPVPPAVMRSKTVKASNKLIRSRKQSHSVEVVMAPFVETDTPSGSPTRQTAMLVELGAHEPVETLVRLRVPGVGSDAHNHKSTLLPQTTIMDHAPQFERHVMLWREGYVCFGICAFCSLAYEVKMMKSTVSQSQPRETLWDIAKFFLICFVWLFHGDIPAQFTAYYDGWFMAGFFLLSGLVSGPITGQKMLRTLRDTVLNQMSMTLMLVLFVGRCYDWCWAWFLVGLCLCRFCIQPCFQVLIVSFGHTIGASLAVAIAILATWFLRTKDVVLWLPDGCAADLRIYRSWWIMSSWQFYTIGLATDPHWLARILRTRVAHSLSASAVAVVLCMVQAGFVNTSDVFPGVDNPFDVNTAGWHTYAYSNFMRLVCILVFLGCLAPIAQSGHMLACTVAALGSRTLYAYWINIFIFGIVGGEKEVAMFAPSQSVAVKHLTILLSASVFCCPLIEACLGWLISPQWILTIVARMVSSVDQAMRCERQEQPQPQQQQQQQQQQ